jgi:hypothetical protein
MFEWLTSPESLRPYIDEAWPRYLSPPASIHVSTTSVETVQDRPARVMHVGAGRSTLGEYLLTARAAGSTTAKMDSSTNSHSKSKQDTNENYSDNNPQYQWNIATVYNVDNDTQAMHDMERRWQTLHPHDQRMQFLLVDYSDLDHQHHNELPDGSMDLIVDKSTLDCALFHDAAAAGLLAEVQRLLHPDGGVYLIVSFHPPRFILDLVLRPCPGMQDWEFTHHVMLRHTEELSNCTKQPHSLPSSIQPPTNKGEHLFDATGASCPTTPTTPIDTSISATPTWSSGRFQPDEMYRTTVNVYLCRPPPVDRRTGLPRPDISALQQHIHQCTNEWYQQHNSMITTARLDDLHHSFQQALHTKHVRENGSTQQGLDKNDKSNDGNDEAIKDDEAYLPLPECYRVLFTDEEREHLTYEYFLEDWDAYCTSHATVTPTTGSMMRKDAMNYETAADFLREMQ